MSLRAVDFNLLKKLEFGGVPLVNCFLDILIARTFSIVELVARESEYFEAPCPHLLVHFYELWIVHVCQSSLACYIDY